MVGFSLATSITPLSALQWIGGFASPGYPWVCLFGELSSYRFCKQKKPISNLALAD